MKFIKLIWSNVKKTLSDYIIYSAANILLVALLFSGNFIGRMYKDFIVSNSLPFIIMIVTVIVLSYINKFMVNKRGREFTIYMLIGLSKNEVILIYSIESICLLLFSFFIGIPLGIGYAYFSMSGKVENGIFSDIVFSALQSSIFYFVIICFFVILFSIYYINKQNIKKLMTINNHTEKVFTYKNLKRNLFILFSLILLFFVVLNFLEQLISIVSVLVCIIIYLANKCIFDLICNSRVKKSKWIYQKENIYIWSKMLKKYKSRLSMSVILNLCFTISACSYLTGYIFLYSKATYIEVEMDEIMGYIQSYIAILFLIVMSAIININQMIDIIDYQRDIFILECLGKNKKQVTSVISIQIGLNILLSVGVSVPLLIAGSLFASQYIERSLLLAGSLKYLFISVLIFLCSKIAVEKCCINYLNKAKGSDCHK